MKKCVFLLFFGLFAMFTAQAQFAKPLKKKKIHPDERFLSVGLSGSYAANDMVYSSITKSAFSPMWAPTFGLALEWNTSYFFAVGLDASYVMRGTNEAFATEFLVNYSTSTFARENYAMSLNGIELRVPLSFYFGDGEVIRPYVFVAPRFGLWLGGQVNGDVAFQGWGDIAHEDLGKRFLQKAEVRLTLLLPLKRPLDDACDFNQKPYRRK